MNWERVTFESLYEMPSKNGVNKPSYVRGDGVKMVNMGELFQHGRIGDIPMERVPMTERELASSSLEEGDLLFARQSLVLEGAGKCSIVQTVSEPTTFEGHLIRVRLDECKADPQFFYYYFGSPLSPVRTIVQQCAQAGIKASELAKLRVHCPTPPTQRRIAAILSAYDDLIENNRRRIQLLEQAARLIYQEWFVWLRYPGHEHVRVVDGVPEGWEKKHLSSLVSTQYGFTETASLEPIGPKFLRGTDINKTSFIDWDTVPYCSDANLNFEKFRLEPGDIVVIRMADPGKVGIVEKVINAVFASYLVRLKRIAECVTSYYLFYALSDAGYQGFISSASTGSTRVSASAKLLVNYPLTIPDRRLVSLFEEQVVPIRRQMNVLLDQNARLRQARDLLLPKLMSGEIEV